jgi:glutathione synthase/RimK-type ligase-like ATP-grasp enzyme
MYIALVTAAHVDPSLTDDRFLYASLLERGHEAQWRAWDDAAVRWQDYDIVLLRSCWGYHEQPEQFRAWIERCARQGVPLVNPPAMVLGNMHKHYLLELAAAGFAVPPTWLLRRGEEADLRSVLGTLGGEDAVVKPAISGTAWKTWRVNDLGLARSETELRQFLVERDMLVQRYEPDVAEQGEWSLVYLGGCYSHAVLKQPKPGDFRSQGDFGGSVRSLDAPPALRDVADRVITMLCRGAAYARIDVIEKWQGPLLMEVELIEPVLYFGARPGSAAEFVAHLEDRLSLPSGQRALA